ncbi:MAG: ribosome small subunit-dependent GTPase A [Pirellulales bacterium]
MSRTSKGKRHIIVSNVEQVLIVASAAEPEIKPHLIDRFLVTAEQARLEAIIVINKVDLIDPAELQPLIGVYAQLGYQVLLTSATCHWSIDRLRKNCCRQAERNRSERCRQSSLLNSIQDGLGLRVQPVSNENMKGKHTTTTAELIALEPGGYLVDTPGIEQLELWDVAPEEVGRTVSAIFDHVSMLSISRLQTSP